MAQFEEKNLPVPKNDLILQFGPENRAGMYQLEKDKIYWFITVRPYEVDVVL